MTTYHPRRKGAGVRTRHEVELAAFYKRHKGGKGARSWRDWTPAEAKRQGQLDLPLPLDSRQSIREQIEQQQPGRFARVPRRTRRRAPPPEEETGEL
jgi:hypothetical protein